jgi:hypothetical protein
VQQIPARKNPAVAVIVEVLSNKINGQLQLVATQQKTMAIVTFSCVNSQSTIPHLRLINYHLLLL